MLLYQPLHIVYIVYLLITAVVTLFRLTVVSSDVLYALFVIIAAGLILKNQKLNWMGKGLILLISLSGILYFYHSTIIHPVLQGFCFFLGLWTMYNTFVHSKKYGGLEITEFVLGVILMAPFVLNLLSLAPVDGIALLPIESTLSVLPFALCFIIGTLMYNNNLWYRYSETYKTLIVFVLVVTLAKVMEMALATLRL